MRKLILLTTMLTLAAVGAIGSAATAQDAQDGQMDQKAMEELMMKLATPGPAHTLLHKLEGKWATTMTSYMDGPEPVTSTGTMTSEQAMGGRYMVGHYTGEAMGMPFEGMSIDGFDNNTQKFFSIWLDNFGTGYYLAHGTLASDGKTLTHTGTMSFGPMEIPTRSETIFADDDKVTFTMWHTMNGQEMKAMEITYTRVK